MYQKLLRKGEQIKMKFFVIVSCLIAILSSFVAIECSAQKLCPFCSSNPPTDCVPLKIPKIFQGVRQTSRPQHPPPCVIAPVHRNQFHSQQQPKDRFAIARYAFCQTKTS